MIRSLNVLFITFIPVVQSDYSHTAFHRREFRRRESVPRLFMLQWQQKHMGISIMLMHLRLEAVWT